ncbi:MAG: tetratricopeptide repeat protein, partial [Lentisphaerae bacterium]|nr:tetratricopeptide repeat protein [Lentisphaerota bacterium]
LLYKMEVSGLAAKIMLCAMLALAPCMLPARDWGGIQRAKQLEKENRFEEAIAIYEQLSDKAKNDQDDQYYMSAAMAAARRMDDSEKARQLAGRVNNPARKAFLLMSLATPAECAAHYKNVDFSAWPDDIRAAAYRNRGAAFNKLEQYDEALADFEQAVSVPGGSHVVVGSSALAAGDIYLQQLNDEARAEAMYRKTLAATTAGYAFRNTALLHLTDLLLKNQRNAEALALYQDLDLNKISIPYWQQALTRGYSKALAANGENIKALKQLNTLLQTAKTPEAKQQLQQEIDRLAEDMLE